MEEYNNDPNVTVLDDRIIEQLFPGVLAGDTTASELESGNKQEDEQLITESELESGNKQEDEQLITESEVESGNKQEDEQPITESELESGNKQVNKTVQQFSYYQGDLEMQSHKFHLDKYYTPKHLADEIVETVFRFIGAENITEVVETSAGAGVFLDALSDYFEKHALDIPVFAYDIEPDREDIVKQDYLALNTYYKPGRLIIGNPPFGSRLQLVKQFYKKAVMESDYIAWILPVSQYQNQRTLYEFDLTHTQMLGEVTYTGSKPVNTCFNIYERPATKVLNKRGKYKALQDVAFYSNRDKGYQEMTDYDIRMIYWGGSAGKMLTPDDREYAGEFKLKIYKQSLKPQIVEALQRAEGRWEEITHFSAMIRLTQTIISEYLRQEIPEIQ